MVKPVDLDDLEMLLSELSGASRLH
jgi:hypothetical protein